MNHLKLILFFLTLSNTLFAQKLNREIIIDTIEIIKSKNIETPKRLKFEINGGELFVNKSPLIERWNNNLNEQKKELKEKSIEDGAQVEDLNEQYKFIEKLKINNEIPLARTNMRLILYNYIAYTIELGEFELLMNNQENNNIIIIDKYESYDSTDYSSEETKRYYYTGNGIEILHLVTFATIGSM